MGQGSCVDDWNIMRPTSRSRPKSTAVVIALTGSDGVVRSQEVSAGGSNASECSAAMVGLLLADGKRTLAGFQDHLVRAQAEEYCRQRRGCSHCGSQRPLKDVRARRLLSLFGTVEVRAPRFLPCQCAVTSRHTLNPVAEIMPDRCTPEYERVIAKMGSLLPYARARTLLSEFLPLGDVPAVETTRRRTMRVGARLEQQAASSQPAAPAAEARPISLFIDGGHVRSVRSYQVRSFEVMLAQVSNDDGKQIVFSSMPPPADRQWDQLRGGQAPFRRGRADPLAALAWTDRPWPRAHRRNHGHARSHCRSNFAGGCGRDESRPPAGWTGNIR